MTLDIAPLPPQQEKDLARLIALAFNDYPAFRYVYQNLDAGSYREALRANFEYYIAQTTASGSQVTGAWVDGALIGGMLVWTPEGLKQFEANEQLTQQLNAKIGAAAFARLCAFEQTMEANAPELDVAYHYLDTIAVASAHQGKGYARKMIEHVVDQSISHDESGAVCLSTESLANIRFYEKLGFEIFSVAHLDEIETTSFVLRT